jgi:anti-sigma B factor antagonist
MGFTRTDSAEETVLKIDGTLDAVTAPELRPTLDAIVAEGKKQITIELSNLRLIDSSGVGVLVSLFKRVRSNGGDVRLVGLRDQPLAIFKLLRLDRVFPGQPGSA